MSVEAKSLQFGLDFFNKTIEMGISTVVFWAILYIAILFFTAWWVETRSGRQNRNVVNNPYIYSLSLAVYCTAWTYFGSVGRASSSGMNFLAVYLGPTLMAPLWFFILRKMVLVSKHQRITSIADFISARFGKSTSLAAIVTILCVAGIVPYISIQLKAIAFGVDILTEKKYPYFKHDARFLWDATFWITAAMILFTVLFGTRKIDPNEKHDGLVAAVALESIVKLVAFWGIGIYVVYVMFNGPSDLFHSAAQKSELLQLFSLSVVKNTSVIAWNMLLLLSAFAFLLLPRQFYISVVENNDVQHINTAIWLLPLYLLLINIFVFPIAIAGKMHFGLEVSPDSYVLSLPMANHSAVISLLAFIGGFAAASGMVIVSSIALSIMISNHLILPLFLHSGWLDLKQDRTSSLINIRRWSIVSVMIMAYLYLKWVGSSYDLVSVGLISFTAVAQFAPATFIGLYWKGATKTGAITGLMAGAIIWGYCLPATSMAEAGLFDSTFIRDGLFGIEWLKPRALFGLTGLDPITHAAWWSLLFNFMLFGVVSVFSQSSALSLTQADLFVNIHKYTMGIDFDPVKRTARMEDLLNMVRRFLGEKRLFEVLDHYEALNNKSIKDIKLAEADLINYLETHLAGAIGAASARLMTDSISKEETLTFEEVMQVMEQTQEVLRYSKELELKSVTLEQVSRSLQDANDQLKALDKLKANFIANVTHELRTPVTSIKSLSKIMLDYRDELSEEKMESYLAILVSESDRIGRLINQVLDIEKLQSDEQQKLPFDIVVLDEVIQQLMVGMEPIFKEKNIEYAYLNHNPETQILGQRDRIMQVLVNLVSNATKFCDPNQGRIYVNAAVQDQFLCIDVCDNGRGIPESAKGVIFEQFVQLNHPKLGKPDGTGLGLYISKQIIHQHQGTIEVQDAKGGGAVFTIKLPVHHN